MLRSLVALLSLPSCCPAPRPCRPPSGRPSRCRCSSIARTSRPARSTAAAAATRAPAQAAFAAAGLTPDDARRRPCTYTITDGRRRRPVRAGAGGHDGEVEAAGAGLRVDRSRRSASASTPARPCCKALNPRRRSRAGEHDRGAERRTRRRSPAAAKVVVDQSDRAVIALDAGGKVIARYPATMGSEHDPLPVGEWKINGVVEGPAGVPLQPRPVLGRRRDATARRRSRPGPTTRSGSSGSTCRRSTTASTARREPENVGKTQSHGCIRLTNWDARRARRPWSRPGMPAVLQE